MIIKHSLPDDPTPVDSPPSYEAVHPNANSLQFRNEKTIEPLVAESSSSSIHARSPYSPSLPQTPAIKSPSSASAKGKGRAPNSWFNFTASKTTREVQTTVLGLIRDLVREQDRPSVASLAILESCADACAGYEISLSTVLQEKSIEGHTPMYWAIVKRPPDGEETETGVPDLLTALISYATPLNPKTIADIRHACLLTSDQLLFQRLRMSPEFSPVSGTDEMLLGGSIPPDGITVENMKGDEGAFALNFEIAHFQKRMLVSKRIELDFIARGMLLPFDNYSLYRLLTLSFAARMWRLEFLIAEESRYYALRQAPRQGSWCISLSLLENSPPTWIDSRLIIPEPVSSSTSPKPTPPSEGSQSQSPPLSSLMDRVRTRTAKPPKSPISIRLTSSQQLVGPPHKYFDDHTAIVVSLEETTMGSSLQYA
ncbi:hypothetical protein H0H92_011806 [Tricholoma furcatifolium]|nr:hypothetical protein H0H92_011806 [Tricholoma furcatifolium]